ncbi:uncharacterized protein RSE6_14616 [Rhynchosporium secalis]|uniref:Uncharacterized protein n=1 Tax=Rhynchosporium secalis TaxID=38038 RepID=A0A1E1MVT9_RHYSE|nr:uncharacterized protein RSE6_14616 [Rhynchosporium secalis]
MWTYRRCLLNSGKKISAKMVISFTLMKSKARNPRNVGYKCGITRVEVESLVVTAFRDVLRKKQSGYQEVLRWLDEKMKQGRLS